MNAPEHDGLAGGGARHQPPNELTSLSAAEVDALMASAIDLLSTRGRLVLDAIAEGVYVLDPLGISLFVNAEGARMLGYTTREIVGQPQHPLIHHTYADGTAHPLEDCPIWHAVRDGVQQHVGGDVFWRKDGTPLTVEYTAIPLKEGRRILGAVITFRDVSMEAEAQRATRTLEDERRARQRAEARYSELQQLFEQAPAAMSMTRGPEHRVVFQNAMSRRIAGRDTVGKTMREAYPEMEGQGLIALMDRVYESGEPYVGTGVRLQWQSEAGEPMEGEFDFVLQPLRDDDGRVTGLMSQSVRASG